MKLFIIGNGFDLHHGMRTSYDDFRTFVAVNHPREYLEIEKTFNHPPRFDLWTDFEKCLELEAAKDPSKFYRKGMTVEEADAIVRPYKNLIEYLEVWIDKMEYKSIAPKDYIKEAIAPEDKFLSFNYTFTLESLYVPEESWKDICHIHGTPGNAIEAGHDIPPENMLPFKDHLRAVGDRLEDSYIISDGASKEEVEDDLVKRRLDEVPTTFYKNTARLISKNDKFFNSIDKIDSINILGWSVNEIDEPYLNEILKRTDAPIYVAQRGNGLDQRLEKNCRFYQMKHKDLMGDREFIPISWEVIYWLNHRIERNDMDDPGLPAR